MAHKILVMNPGATSTKVAVFEGDKKVFSVNVSHDQNELNKFAEPSDQRQYRTDTIMGELKKAGIDITDCDAYCGRGGCMAPCEGGTYIVNEKMLEDMRIHPVKHPGPLGAQIAYFLAKKYGGRAFTVNSPDTDELCDLARVTGIKGVYRESHNHTLNQKESAIRYAASLGKKYEEMNLILCHLGGGGSVTAHMNGRMIDTNDNIQGDGPMAPTRCGSVTVKDIIKMCFSGKYNEKEMTSLTMRTGGWVSHLGIQEALEVKARIATGNQYAKYIYDATIYQTAKYIGAMAAVLKGRVDAIIITGGIANDKYLTTELKSYVSSFAPVIVMPGEFEMEGLASGALRVLKGEEEARIYTGEPSFKGFDFIK